MHGAKVLALVVIAAMAAGCASAPVPPAVPQDYLKTFLTHYAEKIAMDGELRSVVLDVSRLAPGAYGPEAVLRVDSREWAALGRGEQERLMRKAGMLMLESFRPIQRRAPPATLRTVCTMRILDDRDADLGYIIVGGVDPDNVSYLLTR